MTSLFLFLAIICGSTQAATKAPAKTTSLMPSYVSTKEIARRMDLKDGKTILKIRRSLKNKDDQKIFDAIVERKRTTTVKVFSVMDRLVVQEGKALHQIRVLNRKPLTLQLNNNTPVVFSAGAIHKAFTKKSKTSALAWFLPVAYAWNIFEFWTGPTGDDWLFIFKAAADSEHWPRPPREISETDQAAAAIEIELLMRTLEIETMNCNPDPNRPNTEVMHYAQFTTTANQKILMQCNRGDCRNFFLDGEEQIMDLRPRLEASELAILRSLQVDLQNAVGGVVDPTQFRLDCTGEDCQVVLKNPSGLTADQIARFSTFDVRNSASRDIIGTIDNYEKMNRFHSYFQEVGASDRSEGLKTLYACCVDVECRTEVHNNSNLKMEGPGDPPRAGAIDQ